MPCMWRQPRRLGVCLVSAWLGACAAIPSDTDLTTQLDQARDLLAAGDANGTYALLDLIPEESLTAVELPRYKILLARSLYDIGSPWTAFETIRDFADDHRYSEHNQDVERLEFAIGKQLIQSDASYFIFGTDADDGEIVLSHFVSRYPTAPDVPEALKLLGNLAYAEQRYLMARERFRQLFEDHTSSEWAEFAHFRIAYSGFKSLVGPEYDLAEMLLTRNELRDYLATNPERPEFRNQAGAALATVTAWMATRHLMIADFYREIGNSTGEVHHLEIAARDFGNQRSGALATKRLRAMGFHRGASDQPGNRPR